MSNELIVFIGIILVVIIVAWESLKWAYILFTGSQPRRHDGHAVNCFCCSNLALYYDIERTDRPGSIFVCGCTKRHFSVTGVDQEGWHKNVIRALDCPDFKPNVVKRSAQGAIEEDQAAPVE